MHTPRGGYMRLSQVTPRAPCVRRRQALAGRLLQHQAEDAFEKTHTRQCRDAGKNPRLSRSLYTHEVQCPNGERGRHSRGVELGVATPPAWRRATVRVRHGQAPTGRGEGIRGRGGGGAEAGEGVSEVGGASCESGVPACVSAHVDARVAAVRACATHTEGGELSARRARPAQRLWIDVQGA